MAISFIEWKAGERIVSSTTITTPTFAATQAGDVIIFAGFGGPAGGTFTVKTNNNDLGTFGLIGGTRSPVLDGTGYQHFVGIIPKPTVGSTSITLTQATATQFGTIGAWVVRGMTNPTQDVGVATMNQSATPVLSGLSGTLAATEEFAVGFLNAVNNTLGVNTAQTGSAGFTYDGTTSNIGGGFSHRITAATTAIQAAFNSNATSPGGNCLCASYRNGPAWEYLGAGTVVETITTTHTLTEPANVVAGDLLVAVIASRIASTTSITLPSGWTRVQEQRNNNVVAGATTGIASGMMAYIVRGASAPSYAFTHPVAPSVARGQVVAYRGVEQLSPFDVASGFTTATATTAVSGAGLTTASDDELIVFGACSGQAAAWSAFDAVTDPTTSSGTNSGQTANPIAGTWQERVDASTTTGADTSLAIADARKATAGATGNLTATASLVPVQAIVAGAFKLGQPLIDAIGPSATGESGAAVTSLTWSHTASGANRFVLVGVAVGANPDTAHTCTVTYGGTAMTSVAKVESGPAVASAGYVQLFSLVNPPTGAQTIVVTKASTAADMMGGSISFSGVDQTTPLATAHQATAVNAVITDPITLTVASSLGNIVVDVLCQGGGINAATGAGHTNRILKNLNGNTRAGCFAMSTKAGAASNTISYSFNTADNWAIIGVDINAAAAAAAGTSITPPQGNVAISGTAPTVARTANVAIVPLQGNVALSPTAPIAARTANVAISPSQGNVALSAVAPSIVQTNNVSITPPQGNVALSSIAPTVARTANVAITPLQGNVALSGTAPAAVLSNNLAITPSQGNVALSAVAPTVQIAIIVTPPQGNLALSPTAPGVAATANVAITSPQGNVALSGTAPSLLVDVRRSPPQGNVALSPTPPVVAWTDNRALTVPQGNVALSPTAPSVARTANFAVVPPQGNVALSPTVPSVAWTDNRIITPPQSNLALSPTAATVVRTANVFVTPLQGNVALSPTAPVLTRTGDVFITPPQGNVALSPTAPDVQAGLSVSKVPPQGDVTLSTTPPSVVLSVNRNIAPPQGNVALSGTAPVIAQSANIAIVPLQGNVALSGTAPTRAVGIGRTPLQGNLALSPTAPGVARTANVGIVVPQGNLALSSFAPQIGGALNRSPPQGNLALSGTAPLVARSTHVTITPAQGNLALSSAAPIVARTQYQFVTVPAGNLVLSATAPIVFAAQPAQIVPLVGQLTLSTSVPSVVIELAAIIGEPPSLGRDWLRVRELMSEDQRVRSLKYPVPRPRDLINDNDQRVRELAGRRVRFLAGA